MGQTAAGDGAALARPGPSGHTRDKTAALGDSGQNGNMRKANAGATIAALSPPSWPAVPARAPDPFETTAVPADASGTPAGAALDPKRRITRGVQPGDQDRQDDDHPPVPDPLAHRRADRAARLRRRA